MNIEDVKAGNYYYAEYCDKSYAIIKPKKDGDFKNTYGFNVKNAIYYSDNSWACKENIRIATEVEKAWLNYCIEKDKYIDYGDFLKEYKPTYEKGKWYKTGKYYAKCVKHTNNKMTCSEMIMSGDFRNADKTHYTFENDISSGYKWELVTDLKEIEPYLPKDHPDIQQKPEKFVGRYFKALVENAECSNVIKNNYYLIEEENNTSFRFHVEKYPSLYGLSKNLTENYELMPIGWTPSDVIPEYVECIAAYGNAKLNTIYKTLNNYEADKMFGLTWKQVLIDFKHLNIKFKTSTKEAYDLQNSKQYPLVPEECYNTEIEVGDEVEVVGMSGELGRLIGIKKDGDLNYLVKGILHTHNGYPKSNTMLKGNFSDKRDSHYFSLERLKLVKKANKTTTLDKKVDVISSKVPERLQLKIRETVVENTIEERIKLKLNNLKTIKIKQHVN